MRGPDVGDAFIVDVVWVKSRFLWTHVDNQHYARLVCVIQVQVPGAQIS